jgi:hypothetical protein
MSQSRLTGELDRPFGALLVNKDFVLMTATIKDFASARAN